MKKLLFIFLLSAFSIFQSCKNKQDSTETNRGGLGLYEKLEKLPDSTKVNDITILYLFKNQMLAHRNAKFDSLMIRDKVYKPHQELWDHCYGVIFGQENASKFNNPKGMIAWNKTLYPENKSFFDTRARELLAIDIDSVLQYNLNRFGQLVSYKPKAKISILFTPLQGIGFGGCSDEQFCFELNNTDYEVTYTMEKGVPHELNHLAYEPLRENDPKKNTALHQTIDEGFACYFTWIFFDKKISKHEAVEDMSERDWNWYITHEKQIYHKLKPYFEDESGDNPLLRNDKFQLFENAPKSLNYWLGFRIVEKYVEKHGAQSWKDIYTLNVQDVLDQSGYEVYINSLE